MNYNSHYIKLIEKASVRVSNTEYVERHHIIPLCLGGDNRPSNLVSLTAREHYVAHLLLAKIYGDRLWIASHLMGIRFNRQSSRMYERSKLELSARMKILGKVTQEKGLGIFSRTPEEKLKDCKKGGESNGRYTFENKIGVHARSKEQMTLDGKKGGRLHFINKTGLFSPGAQAKGGKKPHWYNPQTGERKRDYVCPEEGFIRGRGPLPRRTN